MFVQTIQSIIWVQTLISHELRAKHRLVAIAESWRSKAQQRDKGGMPDSGDEYLI
jgi:hypothetical protein